MNTLQHVFVRCTQTLPCMAHSQAPRQLSTAGPASTSRRPSLRCQAAAAAADYRSKAPKDIRVLVVGELPDAAS